MPQPSDAELAQLARDFTPLTRGDLLFVLDVLAQPAARVLPPSDVATQLIPLLVQRWAPAAPEGAPQ